jgi:hypothetical protein
MNNRNTSEPTANTGSRWLLGGALFGVMALVAGCVAPPAQTQVRTTTVERTTTQETVPLMQPGTTYTTTQQSVPVMPPGTTYTTTPQSDPTMAPVTTVTTTRTRQYTP